MDRAADFRRLLQMRTIVRLFLYKSICYPVLWRCSTTKAAKNGTSAADLIVQINWVLVSGAAAAESGIVLAYFGHTHTHAISRTQALSWQIQLFHHLQLLLILMISNLKKSQWVYLTCQGEKEEECHMALSWSYDYWGLIWLSAIINATQFCPLIAANNAPFEPVFVVQLGNICHSREALRAWNP